MERTKIRKVVIPAAGLGTRLYPLTRAQPKEMIPVLDKPVIHYVVEEAVNSGLDEILIIVGKGKEALINYFDRSELDGEEKELDFPNIYFVRQKEQRGLADAVLYSEKFVGNEPFVVLTGDVIFKASDKKTVTSQLIEAFEREKSTVIGVERVPKEMVRNYGIIKGEKMPGGLWRVEDMVEKPEPKDAPSDIAATGQYVFKPDIFEYIKKTKPGKNGEYQLTDSLRLLCKEKKLVGCEFKGKIYDIGTVERWVQAFLEFAKDDPRFSGMLKEQKKTMY